MKRAILYGLLLSLVTVCVAVACYPVLFTAYASFFTVNNATKGADALVVLSGSIQTRLPRAIELYQSGYAPRILLTETRPASHRFKHILQNEKAAAQAIRDFLEVDVPLTVVPSQKGGATSTFDEAYDLRRYSREHGFTSIIIVTCNHHTRRALKAFEKVFEGSGIAVRVMGAPNDVFDEGNWWQSDRGIAAYFMEGLKYCLYLVTRHNVAFVRNY